MVEAVQIALLAAIAVLMLMLLLRLRRIPLDLDHLDIEGRLERLGKLDQLDRLTKLDHLERLEALTRLSALEKLENLEVLGASSGDNDITWWENTDGTGTSWAEHTVDGEFNGANCVYATDVNGDGYTDVLGTSSQLALVSWWQVIEYASSGYLESSILDTGQAAVWEFFSYNRFQPAVTSLGFQFRSSQDPGNMGEWSDTLFDTTISLTGILADSTEFMQYKAILLTTDPLDTPILADITVSYSEYLGIQDDSFGVIPGWSLAPAANPMLGDLVVRVSVPQQERIYLVVHDITGRIIARFSQELPGGSHSITVSSLPHGLYFCTMLAGDFTATERVVVLE